MITFLFRENPPHPPHPFDPRTYFFTLVKQQAFFQMCPEISRAGILLAG